MPKASRWPIPEDVPWDSAIAAPGQELLCHNDLAPWNLILPETGQMVFIDGDAAGPSTALWDLAYAVQALCERPAAMRDHLAASHAQGLEPWASMYAQGHGEHWAEVTDWVQEHRQVWAQALL